MMDTIRKEFIEAQEVLTSFMAKEKTFSNRKGWCTYSCSFYRPTENL